MLRPFRLGTLAILAGSAALCTAGPTPGNLPPAAPSRPAPAAGGVPPAGAPKIAPARVEKPEAGARRERTLRDPTVPGPTLRPLISKPAAAAPVAVPPVELKGRILAGPRPPMVTLAIGAQLHMVSEGSRISLPGAGEILVSKVTAEVVELEILPLRYTVTLH